MKNNKDITKKNVERDIDEVGEDEMDKIVVYLHEDVANSSLGDGDGGHVLEDLVEENVDVDAGLEDVDADLGADTGLEGGDAEPDIVVDSDADNDPDSDADLQDDPDKPSRKSVRFSRAPKVFTYNKIGGPPVL